MSTSSYPLLPSRLLQVLRIQYQKELGQNHVTIQTKFNYSWGLVKSPIRDHQVEGVRLLQGVYTPTSYQAQLNPTEHQ